MKKNKTTFDQIVNDDPMFETELKKLGWDKQINDSTLYVSTTINDGFSSDYIDFELWNVSEDVWDVLKQNGLVQGDYRDFEKANSITRFNALGYALISADYYAEVGGDGEPIKPTEFNTDHTVEPLEQYAFNAVKGDDSQSVSGDAVIHWTLEDGTEIVSGARFWNVSKAIYSLHEGFPKMFEA